MRHACRLYVCAFDKFAAKTNGMGRLKTKHRRPYFGQDQRAVIYPVAGPGLVTGQWSCMRLCTHRSINSADWFNSPAVSPSSPIPVCHIFSSFFCFHLIDDKLIIMYIMYGYGTLIKSSEQMCEYSITEDTILSVSIRSFHAKIAGYEMM